MIANRLEVICVGNSHLASFSRAMKNEYSDDNDISMRFWPVQYMKRPWFNFRNNDYLSAPEFNADNPAKLNDQSVPKDVKSVLILVGLGLSGNSVFTMFGDMVYGNPKLLSNGFSCSPLMPYVYGKNVDSKAASEYIKKRNPPCYSHQLLTHIFNISIDSFLYKLSKLVKNSGYEKVLVVPAPFMPERVARWRFGRDYYFSKSQCEINALYTQMLRSEVMVRGLEDNVLFYPAELENEFGFADNRYAKSNQRNDYHVNSEFYTGSVRGLKEHISHLMYDKSNK